MQWLFVFRKKCIVGFISADKMHYGIHEIFHLRNPFGNSCILPKALGTRQKSQEGLKWELGLRFIGISARRNSKLRVKRVKHG